ncbi:hypothetical protein PP914_gp160 [Arthrobacter phage Qui]|jgi:hypothetical protein|uniref:Uncharacterized protein n=1 Tax=Arthrobacter phage Qui TaxID=2603260 RepID=A0A5B8WHX6_9CAUD|nr:hypothetical protein PP914_gp160 [Arthrobacter phage Qui]QED11649.1 hypothetical protein SEA_QUI_160 [Arthrobacter phage Qui]QOC56480.1 hypothetical protein SEA_PAELLA_160 [Arthrobacter phage Paella]
MAGIVMPTQVIEWKIDEIGMVRQSISDMRDSEHPIFNQLVRQHNQKIHDFRQGKV